jgi:GlcNAc-PI de-N-acetylase/Carbohydrate family 9 binding domain-like
VRSMKRSLRRYSLALAAGVMVAIGAAMPGSAAPQATYTVDNPIKINVMGEWAHPDDDTSIVGPCGVWHQRYGVRCGIIMITRGEGGGNAVGQEIGPDLGLRRENEDRAAHYRSGTVDIFNLDRVDFFFNQSAPLTQFFWGHDETLGRITRVIRMTKPDVYIGFTPTLAAGHGNHQWAGRMIWEGINAAANPSFFPEQLTGPHALSTWQVKKAFSGGSTAGTGGTTTAADCTTGFIPTPGTNLDTVAGVWTGYDSPYLWPPGNVQGRPAGTPKIWAQVASEGSSAYPTQSRVMNKGTSSPGCSRFGQTLAYVPFQPNTNPDGTANPLAGRDDAILFGATVGDPGGLPLGTLEYLTFDRFFNVAGQSFQATLHVKSGSGTLPTGTAALTVPAGWTVDAAKPIGPISDAGESTVTFTVTPSASAAAQNFKISALLTSGAATGYTDNVVRIVPAVEGRFDRWGKWGEFDQWLNTLAPQALRLGRSAAVQSMGIGETINLPVDVHNWSTTSQSGTVTLTVPAGFTVDATSKPYGPLAPGGDATVNFVVTNTDTALPGAAINETSNTIQQKTIGIATSYSTPAASASENLTLSLTPVTIIPQAPAAPTLNAAEGPGEYTGPALDLSRRWSGGGNCAAFPDCGTQAGTSPGDPNSTYAKVTWHEDNLYFFIHVKDDFQSYAVTPAECIAHWLADSVEILIDPRGNGSQLNLDTAAAFKLGIFPFTNDPSNFNGNGANGACWERDADNHQGYSTGPLAATIDDAPNAPGVQVVTSATWVGTNDTGTSHSYGAEGGYSLEVKIPLADLPSAIGPTSSPPTGNAATNTIDPSHLGLNITPYDEDDTAAAGTTTLRHIDNSTRLAWSADTGGVQADPFRWGHAYLAGYTPPAGRSTTPATPNVSHPNLDGVLSPQTIYQSAVDGVPISGRKPAPADDSIAVGKVKLSPRAAGKLELEIDASGPGTAQIFLWTGDHGAIPVFLTSCAPATNPPPDYGFSACATTDGGIPPWSPDMSGRVVAHQTVTFAKQGKQKVKFSLDGAAWDKLAADGSALISFETPNDEVQALFVPDFEK